MFVDLYGWATTKALFRAREKKTAYRLLEVVSDSDAAAPSWPSVLVDKSQYFVALDFKNSRGKDSNNFFFCSVNFINLNVYHIAKRYTLY